MQTHITCPCRTARQPIGINKNNELECRSCNRRFKRVATKKLRGHTTLTIGIGREQETVYLLRKKGNGIFPLDKKCIELKSQIAEQRSKKDD